MLKVQANTTWKKRVKEIEGVGEVEDEKKKKMGKDGEREGK
jgi:hypothetical protein